MPFSIQRSNVTKDRILNPSSASLPQLAPPSLSHSFLHRRSQPSCRPSKPPYRNSAAGSEPKHLRRGYSSSVAPRTRRASPDPLGNSTSAIRQRKGKEKTGWGFTIFQQIRHPKHKRQAQHGDQDHRVLQQAQWRDCVRAAQR